MTQISSAVAGSMILNGAAPKGLHVAGSLYLSGCTGLTSLPEGMHVAGSLDLSRCTGLRAIPRTVAQRAMLKRVAETVQAPGNRLGMRRWHTCETTHCIAGWAAYLAGVEGGEAPSIAGYRLLGAEAATHFYDSDADAMAWLLEAVARDEAEDAP